MAFSIFEEVIIFVYASINIISGIIVLAMQAKRKN
jgi:hypothetical protein